LITIETQVLQSLIEKLDPANALKLKEQFKYSIYIRRLELPPVIVTEFYAESLTAIPVEYLFENRGEWDLANIKFEIGFSQWKFRGTEAILNSASKLFWEKIPFGTYLPIPRTPFPASCRRLILLL